MKKKTKSLLTLLMVTAVIMSSNVMAFATGPEMIETESRRFIRYDIDTQEETIIDLGLPTFGVNDVYVTQGYAGQNTTSTHEIIGDDDDRDRVYSVTSSPYHAIVYIETYYDNNTSEQGTGFMIAPDVLLTAAHCVKSSTGGVIEEIRVYAGKNGNSYSARTTADLIYTDVNYSGAGDWNDDYSYVTLNSPIGNTCGWLGLYATSNSSNLLDLDITTAGYPHDMTTGDWDGLMYVSEGTITSVNTKRIYHSADTWEGQSGSPIYYLDSDGDHVAVAIHVGTNDTYNIGKRITMSLMELLEEEGFIDPV